MEDRIDIPDLDEITDLGSAKFLIRHLLKTMEQMHETMEGLRHDIQELSRSHHGQKSERVVPVDSCGTCGCPVEDAAPLADEVTEEYEYVPAHVIRREHWRRRKVCHCGHFFVAPAPPRVVEGGIYGPGLHARTAVAKCADSIPLDRLAKGFRRAGVPLSKSTMGALSDSCRGEVVLGRDLFHRTADHLEPVADRILELIAAADHVHADETSLKV